MAVPKRKTTPSKRNMRRSHDALVATNAYEDPETGDFVRRHHINLKDGTYRGRQVLDVQSDD